MWYRSNGSVPLKNVMTHYRPWERALSNFTTRNTPYFITGYEGRGVVAEDRFNGGVPQSGSEIRRAYWHWI